MISKKIIVIVGMAFTFASLGILFTSGFVMNEINKVSNSPDVLMSVTQNHPLTVKFLEKHPDAVGGVSSSCSFGTCQNTVQYQTQTFDMLRVESLRFSLDEQNQISSVVLECIGTNTAADSLQSTIVETVQEIEGFECI